MTNPNYNFQVNDHPLVETTRVGREQHSVLIIDDVMEDVRSLIEYAAREVEFLPDDQTYYPGIRAPLPKAYIDNLSNLVLSLAAETFGFSGDLLDEETFKVFSLTTTPPEQLHLLQRYPHADTTDDKQLAVLHYLCDPAHGGTSFYRHRETGYESSSEERQGEILRCLQDDIDKRGPPVAKYINGDNHLFERIGGVEAKFDRVVIYRSQVLHSADIDPRHSLDDNPRTGRLTTNLFLVPP